MDVNNGTLVIKDRRFTLYRETIEEKSQYVIQSEDWVSLVGYGKSIDEALDNLTQLMREVLPHYSILHDELLTRDGQEMVAWLKQHIII